MNEIASVSDNLRILSTSYARRWFNNGPRHQDNERLQQLESAAAEAHAALENFLLVFGK